MSQFRTEVTRRCERSFITWCIEYGGHDVKVYDGDKTIFSGGAWSSRSDADSVANSYYTNARNAASQKVNTLTAGYRAVANAWLKLTSKPCEIDVKAPACIDGITTALAGRYENHLHDNGGKNDWHYVTISAVDSTKVLWTNRAGASWTLTKTSDPTTLTVGADCPCFTSGYRTATVQWSPNGKVTGIIGPAGEPYTFSN